MGLPSLDLRRRLVEAYKSGLCSSYEEVAEMFGVGRATVSRNLRRERETGDVLYKARVGRKRRLDRAWLARHAEEFPDATRKERADAWEKESGQRVSLQTFSKALRAIGWSFKKRHQWRASGTPNATD